MSTTTSELASTVTSFAGMPGDQRRTNVAAAPVLARGVASLGGRPAGRWSSTSSAVARRPGTIVDWISVGVPIPRLEPAAPARELEWQCSPEIVEERT
jgi:hypothetical protein